MDALTPDAFATLPPGLQWLLGAYAAMQIVDKIWWHLTRHRSKRNGGGVDALNERIAKALEGQVSASLLLSGHMSDAISKIDKLDGRLEALQSDSRLARVTMDRIVTKLA